MKTPVQELPGGLYLSLPIGAEITATNLKVTISQLLTDSVTGARLPADRLMIGTDSLTAFPQTGTLTFPVSDIGLVNLRIAIKVALFDAPGLYEGRLRLVLGNDEADATYVPIRINVQPWAAVKLALAHTWLTPEVMEPEPGSYISSGEQQIIYVSSNSRWQLQAQASKEFTRISGPVDMPLLADLRLRVLGSQWLQPSTSGFIRVTTDQPVVVAIGSSTKDCPDGWLPVNVELRFPYSRQQAAGAYSNGLVLSAVVF